MSPSMRAALDRVNKQAHAKDSALTPAVHDAPVAMACVGLDAQTYADLLEWRFAEARARREFE